MYEAFYGFSDKPFGLLPDPAFLYLSRKHAAALSMLEYTLSDQAGFVVVTGEVGCGKTILVRRFLKLVDRDTTIGLISNTHSAFGDLLHWILVAFDIRPLTEDKSALYRALIDFLVEQYAAGRRTILVVDEAQNMSLEVLEELRLLSNLNADKDLLLQIIMVGQPELLDKLRRTDLRQFAQRIAVNYHLPPLDYPETRAYIRHRLLVARGRPDIFTEAAVAAVFCCTGGTPRLINLVCDMALVYGYAEAMAQIDIDTILLVAEHKGGSGLGVLPEAGATVDRAAVRRRAELLMQGLGADLLNAETDAVPLEPATRNQRPRREPTLDPIPLAPTPLRPMPNPRTEPARSPELRAPEPLRTERRTAEMRAPDLRSSGLRAPDLRAAESRIAESRIAEPPPQPSERRIPETPAPELRAPEPRQPEIRVSADDPLAPGRPVKRRRWVAWLV